MKKAVFLSIVCVFLMQGVFPGGWGAGPIGSRDAAATPAFNVRPIHPLPDWDSPGDLQSRRTAGEEEASESRLKITFPVGLLATLVFFLMWKFMQGQD